MTTSEGAFLAMLREASKDAGKRLTVLRTAGAAADHVLHPAFPEGAYLTAVPVQVVMAEEQEHVSKRPPGLTAFRASALIFWYFRLARGKSRMEGASLGGSHTTTSY